MALETASYISQLVATNPPGTDPLAQADDHLRLIKGVLQTQFPNLGAAAVTPTAVELNYVDGVTSAIQTQLDAKFAKSGGAITGDATISGTLGVTGALSGTTGAFSGSVTGVTETAGDSSTKYATTAYVQGTAFAAALPSQTGNSGKFVTTNGSAASWSLVPLTSGVSGVLPLANGGTNGGLTVPYGGTGVASLTAYAPIFGGTTSTGAVQSGTVGTAGQVLTSNGAGALPTFQAAGGRNLLRLTVVTATGTWTKGANTNYVRVRLVGGGGGGGGISASSARVGGSGGGGGYSEKFIDVTAISSVSVTIGAGGTGGAAGANAGSTGGTTSFGAHNSATGGVGGLAGSSNTIAGSDGGSGSGGDFNSVGGGSSSGSATASVGGSGVGGSSLLGGGAPGFAANGDGVSATGYGGGGSGAMNGGATTAQAGGDGKAGVVIVEEYA